MADVDVRVTREVDRGSRKAGQCAIIREAEQRPAMALSRYRNACHWPD
jgi:hypothetical protein